MATNIKITALTDIGGSIAPTTLLPVVNMSGTPETMKANVQNFANTLLSSAGNLYSPAAQAISAQTVANAAQPAITSVGTLTSLAVSGTITAGNASLGNLVSANFFAGDGGLLSNITTASTANANYANFAGTAFSVAGGNISGSVANAAYADFAGEAYLVAGANVSGTVSAALVASAVASVEAANVANIPATQTFAVAKGGNDLIADGSLMKPFLTIQAAIDAMANVYPPPDYSVIQIYPGVYNEDVTITNPRIALVGLASGDSQASTITGNVVINATTPGNVYDQTYHLEKLNFYRPSVTSDIITVTGTEQCSFTMADCVVETDATDGKCLAVDVGNASGIWMQLQDTTFRINDPTNAAVAIDISNVFLAELNNTDVMATLGGALKLTNSVAEVFNSLLICTTASTVVEVISAHASAPIANVAFGAAQCYFETAQTSNPAAISLSANVGAVLNNDTFKIPDTGGAIVKGVDETSTLIYGFLGAFPGYTANVTGNVTANSLITTLNFLP